MVRRTDSAYGTRASLRADPRKIDEEFFLHRGTALAEADNTPMRTTSTVSFALAAGIVAGCVGSNSDDAARTLEVARLSGAVFTTLVDGTRVDANIYAAK